MQRLLLSTQVCPKFTGASKLGNVTLFECQLSSICEQQLRDAALER